LLLICCKFKELGSKVLRRLFGPERDEVYGKRQHYKELQDLYCFSEASLIIHLLHDAVLTSQEECCIN